MKSKHIILIGSVIAVVIAGTFGFSRMTEAQDGSATNASGFQIEDRAVVQMGDLTNTISATGTISPIREVTLSFQSQIIVAEILVEEGDFVHARDVIARIDSRTFDERLHTAEMQLELAQIAYNDLISPPRDVDVAAAEASVRSAQLALGPGTAISGPDSAAARLEEMELELALNQNWQAQMRNEDFDPGLDAAWLRLIRLEEGTDEWEGARQDYYAAEARETLNQADVQSWQAGVDVARAELDAELNRTPTYAGSSNAYAQLVQARINLEDLVGDPDAIDLARAELDVAIAESNLEYVQEIAQQAVLVAPFDGIIAELNLVQGAIPAGNAVVMVDNSTFEIIVSIDELDIASVYPDQTVSIELDALPEATISGIVDNVALTPTLRGDVVTYAVRITVDDTEVPIRTGMSGRTWIATEAQTDVIYVPGQFVRFADSLGEDVVVVLSDDGSFDLRSVTLGIENGTNTQILEGVDRGETVVLLSPANVESLARERAATRALNQQ